MGDIVAVSGDAAKAMEYYESALSHRQMADINEANKAQAGRTHLYKSAIAAMINEDMQIARSRAAEYYAAAEADGTAFERRRIHELAGYLAEDSETAVNELSQASQLDPIVLYWFAVAQKDLGNKGQAIDLATRAANRNTLSPNLPFFRDEALQLLDELGVN
jgi:tetratricopeptide (TPR) repeat protein